MPDKSVVDSFSLGGIHVLSLVFGFIGAALGIGYMPPMSKRQMAMALLAGVACAALFPQLIAHYYQSFFTNPIPGVFNNIFAFIFGITGMFIVPGFLVAGEKFKSNPWWVIDWIRGRTPPGGPQ